MRPWIPSNNWYQGPFDNQGYNVVYNSGRRGSLTESNRTKIVLLELVKQSLTEPNS